ncbi:hypothetical protein scyTo_0019749, partial [Scyliorhinus torazame]|nr:hypothetical protein [Scyliorhinus torazame]
EAAIAGLQPQITAGLTKLQEIRKTEQALNQCEDDLDANKDFEYEVDVIIAKEIDISGSSNYANNCQKCHFTCHYPCRFAQYVKRLCDVMTWSGYCTVCPNKCKSADHCHQKYKFEYEIRKVKRSYIELKEKYEKMSGEKMNQLKIMGELQQELDDVQDEVLELIEQASQSFARLDEIALRPNPLSTPACIELLIQTEEEKAKPGFMERVQLLNQVKKQAEIMAKVAGKEELLPDELKEYQAGKKRKKGRTGVKGKMCKALHWINRQGNRQGNVYPK